MLTLHQSFSAEYCYQYHLKVDTISIRSLQVTPQRVLGLAGTPSGFEFDCLPLQARRYIRSLECKISDLKNEFTIRKEQEYSELEIRLQNEKAVRGWLERELERQDRVVEQQRQEILHLTSDMDITGRVLISQTVPRCKTVTFLEPIWARASSMALSGIQQQVTAKFSEPTFSPKITRQHMRKYVPNAAKGSTDIQRSKPPAPSAATHPGVFSDPPSYALGQSATPRTNIDPVIDIIQRQAYDKLINSIPAAVSDETGFWNQLMNDLATSAAQTMLELQNNNNESVPEKAFREETEEQIAKRKKEIARFFTKLTPGSGAVGGGQHSSKHPDTVSARCIMASQQSPFHALRTTSIAFEAEEFLNGPDADQNGYSESSQIQFLKH
ncbi:hypothetical protein QBC40DRAFT_256176 [Triangularia verruculosa]|uniref:Uncharacterized protein n=1 Tax=Triangularia verruculosa TaxID=2587418 RepID=A0AAN6XCN7_9PEZI|nr:hypothetical protein QBC40DRAFT_256176 [Triangularia verruculosa]